MNNFLEALGRNEHGAAISAEPVFCDDFEADADDLWAIVDGRRYQFRVLPSANGKSPLGAFRVTWENRIIQIVQFQQ